MPRTLPDGALYVDLPGDHWAEVRTVDDLRQADVRAILRAADRDGIDLRGRVGLDMIAALQQAAVVQMVRRWSLVREDDPTQPLPITTEAVLSLRTPVYRPLRDAVADVVRELLGGGPNPGADPKSEPSSSPLVLEAS